MVVNFTFSQEDDPWLVVQAMDNAAHLWGEIAQTSKKLGYPHLTEQFESQAEDARRISAELQEAI
ncbi:MAG: hypothetical protein MI920_18095 [Kiloniellales bacterium]|nr:hypothetical protein [Kiloniellales bacterium]